jgi:hypothetical protein
VASRKFLAVVMPNPALPLLFLEQLLPAVRQVQAVPWHMKYIFSGTDPTFAKWDQPDAAMF